MDAASAGEWGDRGAHGEALLPSFCEAARGLEEERGGIIDDISELLDLVAENNHRNNYAPPWQREEAMRQRMVRWVGGLNSGERLEYAAELHRQETAHAVSESPEEALARLRGRSAEVLAIDKLHDRDSFKVKSALFDHWCDEHPADAAVLVGWGIR